VGKRPDPLGCLAAAIEEYPAEAIVRIGCGCPFVDPMLIDRLVIAAETEPGHDYVSYCSRDGRPAILSPMGVNAEWISTSALRKLARRARTPQDRESVTRYLHTHPEKFRIHFVPAPERIDREDVRLTVDIEEDWEHTVAIFEALGPDELDWQRIAELLYHQPALRKRMAALNRAHAQS
jgi:spore coat polysaccharide biosynthesis protein SpsF